MATQITTGYRFHKLERETIVLNQPKLNPPTISTSGEVLSVLDGNNGSFTEAYKVYVNSGYLLTSEKGNINLSAVEFPAGQLDVPIAATCIGTYFNDSDYSNVVIFRLKGYLPIKNDNGITANLYTSYNLVCPNPLLKPNTFTAYLE